MAMSPGPSAPTGRSPSTPDICRHLWQPRSHPGRRAKLEADRCRATCPCRPKVLHRGMSRRSPAVEHRRRPDERRGHLAMPRPHPPRHESQISRHPSTATNGKPPAGNDIVMLPDGSSSTIGSKRATHRKGQPRLWMIGEAPGEYEIARQIPFTGPSGTVLDAMCREAGIDPIRHLLHKCLPCPSPILSQQGRQGHPQ
jgi:hypothetical protein